MFKTNPRRPFDDIAISKYRAWYPKERTKPDPGTFEIGLVLAGAVSAGAYTSGVLDFLFEALDAWHTAKETGDDVPRHITVVKLISGASAGGIVGAIVAASCRYAFPPVQFGTEDANGGQNPFYNAWVKRVKIEDMLDTSDLSDDGPVASILNCETLEDIATEAVNFSAAPADPAVRGWLENPFQTILTLTNTNGVPYTVRMSGNSNLDHPMSMHQDHIAFAVPVFGEVPTDHFPPDVVELPPANSNSDLGWKSLAQSALATGAFPVALRPREIWRQPTDYEYRYAYVNSVDQKILSKPWPSGGPDPHKFISIDGGAMNNEPFEMVRQALSGTEKKNPRKGLEAKRAVVMIDPFSEASPVDVNLEESMPRVLLKLFTAYKSQTRFKQIDLSLAEAEDVYSRFLLAPARGMVKGNRALASGGLGAFLGFFHKDIRHHDFMLGRANCQRFLRDWFVLPKDNPLFENGTWSANALANSAFASRVRPDHLQIIPLVNGLDQNQSVPVWPLNSFEGYGDVADLIEKRVKKMYPVLRGMAFKQMNLGTAHRIIAKIYLWPLWNFAVRPNLIKAAKSALDAAAADLRAGR